LTDFEEFAVYECRSKPTPADKVRTGRVLLLSYKDYVGKWDEIASIFSHEAVMQGKFDASAHTPSEKDRLMREVESTDRGIDCLVYELYGLTEEEIRIVEDA
jgi:hypothetical protein